MPAQESQEYPGSAHLIQADNTQRVGVLVGRAEDLGDAQLLGSCPSLVQQLLALCAQVRHNHDVPQLL